MVRDIIIYAAGNALSRFCALLMFPLYAKTLSETEFTRQDLALTFAAILTLFAGLGMENGYARRFHDQDEVAYRGDLAATLGMTALATLFVFLGLGWLWLVPLTGAVLGSGASVEIMGWCLAGVVFSLFRTHIALTLQLRQKAARFALLSIGTAALQLGLVVWLVVVLEQQAVGVVRAYAGAMAGSCVLGITLSGWIWKGCFSAALWRRMAAFGLPLLPAALGTLGMEAGNRFLLMQLAGTEETAVFVVGSRLAGMLGLLMMGFQTAWGPVIFKAMKEPERATSLCEQASRWLIYIGGLGVGALTLFAPELILFLSKPEYAAASRVIPMLALSGLMWSFFYILCAGYQYANRSHHQAISFGIGLLVMLPLAAAVIPYFGAAGSAVSVVAGYLAVLFYAWRASNRYLPVPYRWLPITVWAAVMVGGCGAVMAALPPLPMFLRAGLKALVLAGFAAGGYRYLLQPAERALLWGKLRSIRTRACIRMG